MRYFRPDSIAGQDSYHGHRRKGVCYVTKLPCRGRPQYTFSMLLLGLVLAAAVAASPTPVPPLEQLKTITNVRTTPVCSALRERVGPAIADVMDSDTKIAGGRPLFGTMYHDDIVLHSELRMSFDVMRMENLITPIAKNISSVKSRLEHLPPDADLDSVRKQLQQVIDTQNDALNILSGFVAMYQLGDLMGHGAPAPLGATSPSTSSAQRTSAPNSSAPGAKTLLGAGVSRAPGSPPMPSEDSANVNLGNSPYQEFSDQLADIRQKQDAAELAASQAILTAVDRCVPPSTP